MKTIRTIIGTLSGVLLTFALVAWFSVRRNAAFIQRTIYQGFDQTFVVALVMGCAFLLITVILTVAIVSTEEDEEDEEEEEYVRPSARTRPPMAAQRRSGDEKRPAPQRSESFRRDEEPYRRVSRTRTQDRERASRAENDDYVRPGARGEERPAPRKRMQAALRPDDVILRDAQVKKAPRPRPEPAPEDRPEPRPKAKVKPRPKPEPEEVPERIVVPEEEELVTSAPEALETDTELLEKELEPEAAEQEAEQADAPEDREVPEASEIAEESQPASQPARDEETVRCVFCGSTISRDSLYCPRCGKKR